MYELIKTLYPIYRSITGEGVRKSLEIINEAVGGGLELKALRSGTLVYDWVIPAEYNVRDAYIITPSGKKICEFKKHNLHLLGYSEPVHKKLSLDELQSHLYSNPNKPNSIPYATSYYERRWGFCLSHNERNSLENGEYEVFIDSDFNESGELNYAEFYLQATKPTKDEILISTYICHPQMCNNELSGPAVWCELIKWLKRGKERKYNYRFVIAPETIGAIAYIHENFNALKANVKAGFVLSCLGDDNEYSVVLPPNENSLSARVAKIVLKTKQNAKTYSFLERGSDERQYNTPTLNLGVATLCRTKFGEFSQYHTNDDDLSCVSQKGLEGGLEFAKECIKALELNEIYAPNFICEPCLGKYNLTSTLGMSGRTMSQMLPRHFLAYCDGKKDLLEICELIGADPTELENIIKICLENNLIKIAK